MPQQGNVWSEGPAPVVNPPVSGPAVGEDVFRMVEDSEVDETGPDSVTSYLKNKDDDLSPAMRAQRDYDAEIDLIEKNTREAQALELRKDFPGGPGVTTYNWVDAANDGNLPIKGAPAEQFDPAYTVVEDARTVDEKAYDANMPNFMASLGIRPGDELSTSENLLLSSWERDQANATMGRGAYNILADVGNSLINTVRDVVNGRDTGAEGLVTGQKTKPSIIPNIDAIPGLIGARETPERLMGFIGQIVVGNILTGRVVGKAVAGTMARESTAAILTEMIFNDPQGEFGGTIAPMIMEYFGVTDQEVLDAMDSRTARHALVGRMMQGFEAALGVGIVVGAPMLKHLAEGTLDALGKRLAELPTPANYQGGSIGVQKPRAPNYQRPAVQGRALGYEPDPYLLPEHRVLEGDMGKILFNDYAAAKTAYNALPGTDGGRILSTDIVRELSPAYRADRSLSAPVHEPASAFTKRMYKERLAALPAGSKVAFTAGGTGAGKTSGLAHQTQHLDEAGLIYDTNMAGYASSKAKVQAALDAGHKVEIFYVDRDPVSALDTAVGRAMKADVEGGPSTGRTVPIPEHLATHVESRATVKRLYDEYDANSRVIFKVYDNNGPKGSIPREISVDELHELGDNTEDIRGKLYERFQEIHEAGGADARVAKGFVGEGPPGQRPGATGVVGQGGGGVRGEHRQVIRGIEVTPGKTVSTRTVKPVTAKQFKKGQTHPGAGDVTSLRTGMDSMRAAGEASLKRNVDTFDDIATSFKVDKNLPTEEKAKQIVRGLADNLLALHDRFAPALREMATHWYPGGNRLAGQMAKRAGATIEQSSGVIASQSPQKDWFMNMALAKRIHDGVAFARTNKWKYTPEMQVWAQKYAPGQHGIRSKAIAKLVREGKLTNEQAAEKIAKSEARMERELLEFKKPPKTDRQKGMYVRAWDEAHNPRNYDILSPDGEVIGVAKKKNGKPAKVAWGSYGTIGNGVSILENGSTRNIVKRLGNKHKVRNFYNNIVDPADTSNVTIDTHAVAAANLRGFSGKSLPVIQNFGGRGAAKSIETGADGTYGIYHDAYNLAAKERGIDPREMQSITWEAVRGLFEAGQKTGGIDKYVEQVWKQVQAGTITRDEAIDEIFSVAGGITPPAWSK